MRLIVNVYCNKAFCVGTRTVSLWVSHVPDRAAVSNTGRGWGLLHNRSLHDSWGKNNHLCTKYYIPLIYYYYYYYHHLHAVLSSYTLPFMYCVLHSSSILPAMYSIYYSPLRYDHLHTMYCTPPLYDPLCILYYALLYNLLYYQSWTTLLLFL